jgi:hypothetical protein
MYWPSIASPAVACAGALAGAANSAPASSATDTHVRECSTFISLLNPASRAGSTLAAWETRRPCQRDKSVQRGLFTFCQCRGR